MTYRELIGDVLDVTYWRNGTATVCGTITVGKTAVRAALSAQHEGSTDYESVMRAFLTLVNKG